MKFRIIFNENKAWAAKTADDVAAFLRAEGHVVVPEGEEISIVIGGDGTIFHHRNAAKGAIFGIGSKASKVCQSNLENWKKGLKKALNGLAVEERVALAAFVNDQEADWAINDVVVHARKHNFIEIRLCAGSAVLEFGGDGVIVATPTGSTGYAYSAGGAKLKGDEKMVEIAPICPYLRKAKPFAVPAGTAVEISAKGAADLVIDGQRTIELDEGDNVVVTGNRKVRFVRL